MQFLVLSILDRLDHLNAVVASAASAPATNPTTSNWLVHLLRNSTNADHSVNVAQSVVILAIVAATGLLLGTIRFPAKITLGVAGVLFAGLFFGQMGFKIDHNVMDFAREFGLILFVYTIGVQVGPGFLASLRKQGLPLNLMAAGIVVLGVAITIGIALFAFEKHERPIAVGILSGATTNTPSLGAARTALRDIKDVPEATRPKLGMAYAMAYPFGIVGIILTMLIMKAVFKISTQKEADLLAAADSRTGKKLETMNLELKNPNLDGLFLRDVPTLGQSGVVVSRVLQAGHAQVAKGDTVLKLGDILLAVGPREALEDLKLIVGVESKVDVKATPSKLTARRLLVTKSGVLGQTIQEIDPLARFGVIVTRINRGDVEIPPTPSTKIQFGDALVVVGEPEAIKQVALEMGDSPKQLNHPQIIPIFVGIALGVIIGSWPFTFSGMPAPVRLGLAGGPLLIAIVLSRLGNIGSLVWYLPQSANFALREVGIVLFLACVGLASGEGFVKTLVDQGWVWMIYGVIITFLPLLIMALFARIVMKMNYLPLCGLLAGSMTDPPALAFAGSMTGSDAPSVSYATVYPLVMLLRVLSGQAMILFLMS